MRKVIFSLLFLSCSICVSAQTIRLRSAGLGKIAVTKGKLRSTIDLSGNIAGCPYVSGKYRRDLDVKGCAAPPATFKLIDAAVKNNQTFLVVQAEAMGNCNVCGRCGASEAFTLFWLKLDARFHLLEKKDVTIESCLTNTSLVGDEIAVNENTQDAVLDLKFKNDVLTVKYEQEIYDGKSNMTNYESSHLEYNRKTPEKGFIIQTQKRAF